MNKNPKLHVLHQEEDLVPSQLGKNLATWLEKWGKTASYILLAVVAVLSFGSLYFSKSPLEMQKKSQHLEKELQQLQNTTSLLEKEEQNALLASIWQTLYENPELAPQYEGKISQTLINQGNTTDLARFTTPLFERTGAKNYPLFHRYTENTLLIAEGNLTEAYEASKELQLALKTTLEDASLLSSYELLLAWNQLRIAELETRLSLPESSDTWKALLTDKDALEKIERVYNTGSNSITSYIGTIVK